jgi:hypothetical protein
MNRERIEHELSLFDQGGQTATLIEANSKWFVIYRAVPTAGARLGLPETTDVIVPVPQGYPAAMIDLAGLPRNSPLLARVAGGTNPQGIFDVDGCQWQLASYHPHQGGGGPAWNPMLHGFHTYMDHILSWLTKLQ